MSRDTNAKWGSGGNETGNTGFLWPADSHLFYGIVFKEEGGFGEFGIRCFKVYRQVVFVFSIQILLYITLFK